MAKQVQMMSELEAEPPNETREQAAAAIGASLLYLEGEAVEVGLIEVAHLIGVATQAAFDAANSSRVGGTIDHVKHNDGKSRGD